MVLFVLFKLILRTRMHSHPVGLDVWFLVAPFVYFHTSCVWTAKALARLRGCAGSPEPSLVAYVISTIISWAGSNGILTRCSSHSFVSFNPTNEDIKLMKFAFSFGYKFQIMYKLNDSAVRIFLWHIWKSKFHFWWSILKLVIAVLSTLYRMTTCV